MKIKVFILVLAIALAAGHKSTSVQIPDSSNSLVNSNQRAQAASNGANPRPSVGQPDAQGHSYGAYANNYVQETTNQYQYASPQQSYQATQPQYYQQYYYPQQQQYAQGKLAFNTNQDGQGHSMGGQSGGHGGGFGGGDILGGLGGSLGGLGGGLGGLGGGIGGGHGGEGQDGGILGMFTSLFSGLFNMMGMGDDSHMSQSEMAGGYGWPAEQMNSMSMNGLGGAGGGLGGGLGGLGAIVGVKKGALLTKLVVAPLAIILTVLIILGILFIIYFIPIPIIEPGNDGGKGDKWRSLRLWPKAADTMRLARSVLQSDECVERLSCEIARFGKSYAPGEWVERKLDSTTNTWLHRISRSLRTARHGTCSEYRCPNFTLPLHRLQRLLIPSSIPGGKTKLSKTTEKSVIN